MDEEIGELFLESNFRSRSANKSFMQMIYLLTDDVLTENEEFNVKGYMLASLARSHKGSYGKFASSTSIYLRDEKMSGHSAEFVAKELFERRVLSSVPSMLLKMITGEVYQKLSIENQTRLIKELNLSPLEIEKCVALMQASTKQAISLAEKIYSSYDKKEILNILHRIGNGDAVSKQNECLCAMTAMGKLCPYPEISYCIGCQYEISTKTTMLLLAADFKRLSTTYKTTDNAVQKKRCRSLARNIVAPKINELTRCMKEDSGEEAAEILYEIFQEVRYGID
jgi:hypothetical protein